MTRRRLADAAVALATSTAIVIAAIAASIAVIAIAGHSPGAALSALWQGAFGGKEEIAGTLKKMVPLTLDRARLDRRVQRSPINIGFDGQITAGGITSAVVALEVHGLPGTSTCRSPSSPASSAAPSMQRSRPGCGLPVT